ncbi:MAG: DUF885 domain-containing protein [Aphanocapsa lilacina HA4352-LM1]|jgi:hypothetical protein|nr:DUF885 domain-containing protein [Aphanocapsa lilacina HA4352-LM1]
MLHIRTATVSLIACLLVLPTAPTAAQTSSTSTPVSTASAAWVERSNNNTDVMLAVEARFNPEGAGGLGVDGYDDKVADLGPKVLERNRQAFVQAAETLRKRLAVEKDPLVRQDLEILLKAARDNLRLLELRRKYDIPYINVSQLVFGGLRVLLDDQVPAERRKAALVRLRRYAGGEGGYTPIAVLAEQRVRERLATPGLTGPYKAEVEKDLARNAFFVEGIGELFKKYDLEGYQADYAKLKAQLAAYDAFVRKEVLPKARGDFRLPLERYAFALEQLGVDVPPAQLAAQARIAFADIQRQMQAVALQVAQAKGYSATDYRDVIRALKKEQLVGEAILPLYLQRLKDLEAIIRREKLVSLPDRPARIRLASPAESAATPAPNMRPPRLVGNRGEQGEFVLPLNIPAAAGARGGGTQKFDDFTFDAVAWTLTAHEARPGHELQFAALVEQGVSSARAIYAFNSTNVEGWGLYSEAIVEPFIPAEGQLFTLQFRLLRAARAFLDPELQLGKVTPAEALRVLKEDVVISDAFANQEVERYTFVMPGQATSYFYGYTKLTDLRKETEKLLGNRFEALKFHDFILAQGLLPPELLRKAVLEQFVGTAAAPTGR